MTYSIDRIDHVQDLSDVLAIASVGPGMTRDNLALELYASLDAHDMTEDRWRRAIAHIDSVLDKRGADMEAAALAVPEADATADEFPMQLYVFGLRAVFWPES